MNGGVVSLIGITPNGSQSSKLRSTRFIVSDLGTIDRDRAAIEISYLLQS